MASRQPWADCLLSPATTGTLSTPSAFHATPKGYDMGASATGSGHIRVSQVPCVCALPSIGGTRIPSGTASVAAWPA